MPRPELPTLTGLVPYSVEQAIRVLAGYEDQLAAEIERVRAAIPPPLSLAEIRRALGGGGGAPLNIFTLLGGEAAGLLQSGTHVVRVATNPATLPAGAVFWETDRTAAYMVIGGLWWFVMGTPHGCTLFPDTRPADFTTRDAGFEIRATDFDRLFRWTGSAWIDSPGQPRRGIEWFPFSLDVACEPGTGYQLCDGSANVRISRQDATTAVITAPDLTTANRFLRAVAGATGGTGGAATVDPPSTPTGENDTEQEVEAGTGVTVAADGHTHAVDLAPLAILPPYYDARPYLRL